LLFRQSFVVALVGVSIAQERPWMTERPED